jgi:hypothetical protein
MGNLWSVLERISLLLDDDERQSVLGDIQERGVAVGSLLDLLALVSLRQLEAWKSLGTWVLAGSLLLPAYAAVNGARVVAETVSYYPWQEVTRTSRVYLLSIESCSLIATLILCWATGFSLTVLGRYRAVAVLVPVALLLGWLESGAFPQTLVAATALTLIVGIPGAFGLARGWKGTPLSSRSSKWLVLPCIPIAFVVASLSHWTDWVLTIAAFWPVFYAIAPSTPRQARS